MPIDLFNLNGQSTAPVKKNYVIAANTLLVISILSFVLMLGGCCACVGAMKTEYGEEEFYRKPGGGVGYGARSYTSGGDPTIGLIGGAICIVSFIAGTIVRVMGEPKKED